MSTTILSAYEGNNRLMLITHKNQRFSEYEEVAKAIEGGCKWVQLRMKGTLNIETAKQVAELCRKNNVRLCIDDNVDIALQCGANTVHLGKNDMPVAEAWEIVKANYKGDDFQIGATANTFEDIKHAVSQGASYIGLGPFRFTQTKEKLSSVLGLDGYRKIMQQCKDENINIPVYAIGGIEFEDIDELMKTGITGIAISGAINNADNPTEVTRRIVEKLTSEQGK